MRYRSIFPAIVVAVCQVAGTGIAQQTDTTSAQDATITSSDDATLQHALFYVPGHSSTPVPLLVFLHSWSTDYKTAGGWDEVLDESRKRGWSVIVPNFRGSNDKPGACGSDLAVQDVLDS